MKLGKAGLDLIKHFEGYHKALPNGDCKSYPDVGTASGLPITIGYGTTKYRTAGLAKYGRQNVKLSDTLTRAEAEAELQAEIAVVEAAVNKMTKGLNQNQFDAAVSLFYNTGTGIRQAQRLRAGDFAGFRKMLLAYVKGGDGTVLPGLVRRRKAEAELWDKPIEGETPVRTDQARLIKLDSTYSGSWDKLTQMQLLIGSDTFQVASGSPHRQIFRKAEDPHSMPGSLEPIPQGVYLMGPIEWAGGVDNWRASWGSGLGPIWQDLRNGQTMRRGAFGCHADQNISWAPGSAGCVVFRDNGELERYVDVWNKWKPKKLLVDWGL